MYYPTIDNTNVETLQYIVTDGSTFTDLQTRDMVSTATALDDSGMVCRVTSTARSGKYQIVTDYVTDPDRNTLLMNTRFVPSKHANLKLYVRFDPTVNGNGGGGTGNGAPTRRSPTRRPVIRSRSPTTPTPPRTRPTATTPSRCSPRSTPPSPP